MPVSTNIDALINSLEAKLNDATKQLITYEVAVAVFGPLKARIHNDGLASDGTPIGTYDNAYLKERQKKYDRTADSRIILSLTKEMEKDFNIRAVGNTSYGLGYNNEENYRKAMWNDNRFGRTIFALTKEENEKAMEIAKDALINALTK